MVEQRRPVNTNRHIVISIQYKWNCRLMMTSWHRNTFCITGTLQRKQPVTVWFPSKRTSNVKLSCFLWCSLNKLLNEQLMCQWFERPRYDVTAMINVYCICKHPSSLSRKVSQHFLLLYNAMLHCMWRCNCTKQPEVKISGQAHVTYHIWAIQDGLHVIEIKRSSQGFLCLDNKQRL